MSKRVVKIDKENHIIWFDDGSNEYYTTEENDNNIINKEYQNGNHASYYGGKDNPYECDKVINAWGEQNNWSFQDGWYLGTVLRYLCRNGNKKGNSKEQDLQKCINYLQMYLDKLKSKREHTEPLDYTE